MEVQISGLNGKNIEFENKNKDLEKNIQKLQTDILGLKDENIDLKNEREKQKIKNNMNQQDMIFAFVKV